MKTTNGFLTVILLVILEYISKTDSIQCYKCIVAPYVRYVPGTVLRCQNFDYSDKFIVDCPDSTMCVKKVTYANIIGQINGTERDCAFQKQRTQQYTNGHWHLETEIVEAYEEGCVKTNDQGFRTSKIEHCYCKGDLCNSAGMTMLSTSVVLVMACGVGRTLWNLEW